jgi:hypothetical protein
VPGSRAALAALLAVAALATVSAVLSCWNVGWLSDDWVLVLRTQIGSFFEESRHASLPRRALWWATAQGAGPWLFRLVGLGCHVTASLGVLPRVAALLFPGWAQRTGRLAGLVLLALPVTLEPLVWAAAVSYPILELELLVVAYAHLRWLRDGAWAWRVVSWAATAAALLTWELGVAAPLVVAILSVLVAGRRRRAVGDVAPHALMVLSWLVWKVGVGSTETLAWGGPRRVLEQVVSLPLLTLSPWPLDRHLLTAWPGAVLACAALVLVVLAAWRAGRRGVALLLLAWGVLVPVLAGPGPEARYLLLGAPWLVLLATAGARDLAATCGRAGHVALIAGLVVFCASAAGTSWWLAGRWRAADAIARSIVDGVSRAALARGRLDVVVIDAPDRLPGWGPTSKVPVWRHGLASALEMRGVRVARQAHTAPADPEVLGLRPNTRAWTGADLRRWRARGWLVLACRPDGRGGYTVVVVEG